MYLHAAMYFVTTVRPWFHTVWTSQWDHGFMLFERHGKTMMMNVTVRPWCHDDRTLRWDHGAMVIERHGETMMMNVTVRPGCHGDRTLRWDHGVMVIERHGETMVSWWLNVKLFALNALNEDKLYWYCIVFFVFIVCILTNVFYVLSVRTYKQYWILVLVTNYKP